MKEDLPKLSVVPYRQPSAGSELDKLQRENERLRTQLAGVRGELIPFASPCPACGSVHRTGTFMPRRPWRKTPFILATCSICECEYKLQPRMVQP